MKTKRKKVCFLKSSPVPKPQRCQRRSFVEVKQLLLTNLSWNLQLIQKVFWGASIIKKFNLLTKLLLVLLLSYYLYSCTCKRNEINNKVQIYCKNHFLQSYCIFIVFRNGQIVCLFLIKKTSAIKHILLFLIVYGSVINGSWPAIFIPFQTIKFFFFFWKKVQSVTRNHT